MSTYPPAVQRPGPAYKVWPDQNAREGVILHSLEGSGLAGMSQLVGTTQVSWHFTVLKDGTVWQHYGPDSSCWHAGSRQQNARLIGIEHEGKAGEPLTEAQTQASVELVRWLAGQWGWSLERHVTLLEHNEVYATACPSGRIPWERYVPEGVPENTNIVNGEWDIGATRIPLLGIIETAAREFRRNAGAKADALAAVERAFE